MKFTKCKGCWGRRSLSGACGEGQPDAPYGSLDCDPITLGDPGTVTEPLWLGDIIGDMPTSPWLFSFSCLQPVLQQGFRGASQRNDINHKRFLER